MAIPPPEATLLNYAVGEGIDLGIGWGRNAMLP
jgi:hypothetical protein